MLLMLLACSSNPCEGMQCLCPEGTGVITLENIKEASIQKKDASGKKTEVIPCSASKAGALCSFVPEGETFQVDVLIGEKAFPIDIKSVRKTQKTCCACGYFEFSPRRLTIPYH